MALSQEYYSKHATEGLFPIIEIELNGSVSFDRLIEVIHKQYKIAYRLIKADIEFLGKGNFGKLLLELRAEPMEAEKAMKFFDEKKLKNSVKGYAVP